MKFSGRSDKKIKKITIKEIAAYTGFSTSTISRALNHPEMVKEETRDKVLKAIEKFNYHPHQGARSLRKPGSGLWLASVGDSFSTMSLMPYYSTTFNLLTKELEVRNLHLLLSMHMEKNDVSVLRTLSSMGIFDGFLVFSPKDNDERIEVLAKAEAKFLVLGKSASKCPYVFVDTDGVQGAMLAVDHLISVGVQRLWCIATEREFRVTKERIIGIKKILQKRGISFDFCTVLHIKPTEQKAYNLAMKLPVKKGDGFFCFADNIALGVIKALIDRGVSVGKDVKVVGYDNLIHKVEYRGWQLTLTSVDQNLPLFVSTIVRKLFELVNNIEVESEVLPVKLIPRESTGVA
ncbi:MAG: LacI family DNA-binding transcriptional regulator [Thermotogae bacterium]|nr:LacI family DNA-binding transcriptional regulator [Thermotogota bacterium]